MLTDTGYGRTIGVCMVKCPYATLRHGDRWPHCEFGKDRIELTPEYRNGPDSNCPAGRWAGVKPVTAPLYGDEAKDAVDAEKAAQMKEIISAFSDVKLDEKAVQDRLIDLVSRGIISPEVAEKVETSIVADISSEVIREL